MRWAGPRPTVRRVGRASRTFLVECYLPGVDPEAVAEAGRRSDEAARALQATGVDIAYLGATLVAADEVVFHAFTAPDATQVEAASRAAGLAFERIVESIGIAGADPAIARRAGVDDR